jgi:hypothetical protein
MVEMKPMRQMRILRRWGLIFLALLSLAALPVANANATDRMVESGQIQGHGIAASASPESAAKPFCVSELAAHCKSHHTNSCSAVCSSSPLLIPVVVLGLFALPAEQKFDLALFARPAGISHRPQIGPPRA